MGLAPMPLRAALLLSYDGAYILSSFGHSRTRTYTYSLLRRVPLPLGYVPDAPGWT